MSHEIIKHKFLLTFTEPEHLSASRSTSPVTHELYVSFESSNNVDPRTYDGHLFAHTTAWRSPGSTPTLPKTIWEWAYYAEDGMIKIYPGRNITGTGWIQSWQKIVKRPVPLANEDGRLRVMPTLRFSFGEMHLDSLRGGNAPAFPSYPQGLQEAWNALIRPALESEGARLSAGYFSALRVTLTDTAQLAHAIALKSWAEHKDTEGFTLSLYWHDYQGEELQRIFDRIPEPETAKPIRYEAGMQVSFGRRTYTLNHKVKQSWNVTRDDGQVFRMGPAHLKRSTILQPAAA
jgi:hypothetical protein